MDGELDLAAEIAQLRQGLMSRTVIGQAEGILMERHKVSADGAFHLLVQASSVTNRKLRDVAADLVATGELASGRSGRIGLHGRSLPSADGTETGPQRRQQWATGG